jgi:putative ubiquitin-RnfH superfamily antitoxin RatB of RatAB toxin-antitoxin module
MAPDKARISVEVVYALPERQVLLPLSVAAGTTVHEAIEQSGIAQYFPGLDARGRFGIFGRRVKRDAVLKEGDRIEIYRPLIVDPKDSRRRRAWRKR